MSFFCYHIINTNKGAHFWTAWFCSVQHSAFLKWATPWENLLMPYSNNKSKDQSVHPHSLISIFVIRCLDSIRPITCISKIFKILASLCIHTCSWVGQCREPRRRVFSWRGSTILCLWSSSYPVFFFFCILIQGFLSSVWNMVYSDSIKYLLKWYWIILSNS